MNYVLSLNINNCGEYLEPVTPTLKLEHIKVGNRFQFVGDVNRVREIMMIDGEYMLTRCLGCTEDLTFYKCHYSYLKVNETTVEELK